MLSDRNGKDANGKRALHFTILLVDFGMRVD